MPADGSRQKSSGGPMSTEREDIKKIEKEIDEENVRIVLFGQPGSGEIKPDQCRLRREGL